MKHKSKIVLLNDLLKLSAHCKLSHKKLVWTNGCFDLMHAGHVFYLQQAKKFGDFLVVGINSDHSIKQLKGSDRPICNENHRAAVVAALECVDFVLIFDEKSPVKIIEQLKPDFYIKGGDYTIDTIDQTERKVMESFGGKIIILPEMGGISTTIIIEKIIKLGRGLL